MSNPLVGVMAITDTAGRPIQPSIVRDLETLRGRIVPALVAAEVWHDVFSDSDRQRLGGEIEECWQELGTAGMWMKARDVSLERALLDIAEATGMVSCRVLRRLERALSLERTDVSTTDDRPVWNVDSGELMYRGAVIRKCRIKKGGSKPQVVFDAFQAAGWARQIDNPLPEVTPQINESINDLNKRLKSKQIRFGVRKSGEAIIWSLE